MVSVRLLSSIKPGLVKKINRLPTPIAGLVSPHSSFRLQFAAFPPHSVLSSDPLGSLAVFLLCHIASGLRLPLFPFSQSVFHLRDIFVARLILALPACDFP